MVFGLSYEGVAKSADIDTTDWPTRADLDRLGQVQVGQVCQVGQVSCDKFLIENLKFLDQNAFISIVKQDLQY